jgi:hypothetical protein
MLNRPIAFPVIKKFLKALFNGNCSLRPRKRFLILIPLYSKNNSANHKPEKII